MAWKPSKLVTLGHLKTAIEKIKSSLSMNGILTFTRGVVAKGKQNILISAKWRNANNTVDTTTSIVRVIGTNLNNNYNPAVSIGSLAGSTVVTGGESGANFAEAVDLDNTEAIYMVSDQGINFYTNASNDASSLPYQYGVTNGVFYVKGTGVKGTTPSSPVYRGLGVYDSTGIADAKLIGSVLFNQSSDGNHYTYLRAYRPVSGSTDYSDIFIGEPSSGKGEFYARRMIDGVSTNYNLFPKVGEVVCMSTNTAPNYPGTWTLIDKEFTPQYIDKTTSVSINTTIVTSLGYLIMKYSGHTIQIIINKLKNKVTLNGSGDGQELFTLTPADFGVTAFGSYATDFIGIDSGSSAIFNFRISPDGVVSCTHVFKLVSGSYPAKSISANTTLGRFEATVTINSPSQMVNSYCNKFYFKRTA